MNTAGLLVLLAVGTGPPQELVVHDSVDIIEVNHYYGSDGDFIFDQIIFWNWYPEQGAFRVVAWRLLKDRHYPERDWSRNYYSWVWYDGGDVLREVSSPVLRETWTQFDPELADRQYLAKEHRVGLTEVRPPPAGKIDEETDVPIDIGLNLIQILQQIAREQIKPKGS